MLSYFGCDQSQVQRYLVGPQPHREPAVAALQRLPQGADAVPDPAHGRARVRASSTSTRRRCCGTARSCSGSRRTHRPAELARVRAGATRERSRTRHRAAEAFARARRTTRRRRGALATATSRPSGASRRREADPRCSPPSVTGRRRQRHQLHLPELRGLAAAAAASRGLILAVIFAAAMSALSGELNSLATATMVDFYKRFVRKDGRTRPRPARLARSSRRSGGVFACARRVAGRAALARPSRS